MKAEDIEALLDSIPKGVNPYLFASGALRQAFFPHETKPVYTNLWKALGILLAVDIHLCIIILLGKWRDSAMYLWKWRETPRGPLLVPNTSVAFTLFACLFCIASQPYIWLTIRMLQATHVEPVHFKAQNNCMVLVWLFLVLAVLAELHALCLMTYLTAINSAGHFAWVSKIKARCFNWAFFILYGIVIISLPVAFGVAEVYWNRIIDIACRIQEYLLSSAANWDGTSNQIAMDPELATSMFSQLASHASHFLTGSQVGFSILAACNLLVLWLYVPCGLRYAVLLGSQIQSDKDRRQRGAVQIREDGEESLSSTYKLMVLKTLLIFMAGTPSLVAAGWAAGNLEQVLTNPNAYFAVNMLALGGFAFLGTIALGVMIWITWNLKFRNGFLLFKSRSSGQRSDSPMDINVDVETITFAEDQYHLRVSKTRGESTKSLV